MVESQVAELKKVESIQVESNNQEQYQIKEITYCTYPSISDEKQINNSVQKPLTTPPVEGFSLMKVQDNEVLTQNNQANGEKVAYHVYSF